MPSSQLPQVVQLTPPGRGAVAPDMRIEGPDAIDIVESHFRARSGRPLASYTSDQIVVERFGGEQGRKSFGADAATTPWISIATVGVLLRP